MHEFELLSQKPKSKKTNLNPVVIFIGFVLGCFAIHYIIKANTKAPETPQVTLSHATHVFKEDAYPLEKEPNTKAKPPTVVIEQYDQNFQAKERAKFWQDKGYTFDSTGMNSIQMDYMVRAIERAKYWSERGFQFNPKNLNAEQMNHMVSAYEKAHNLVIDKP